MTAFSDADLDRLADFVGGALDGTPEADDVRRLVSTDEAWAEAYAALVTADATVRDGLRSFGSEAAAVPLDVQQRLDAALRAAITAPPADASVVDLARAREARKRRRQRWMVGLAAAAAVLVCGGVGVQVIRQQSLGGSDSASTSGLPPQNGPGEAATPANPQLNGGQAESGGTRAAVGGSAIVVTGRDYAPDTVGQLAQSASAPASPLDAKDGSANKTDLAGDVPDPLRRLGDPTARAACLTAITREYGGQVVLVDYARFQGQPALVVILDGTRVGAGKRLVVVVGPDCGIGNAIADERYRGTA
ncbi:hypothetical protein KZZ52_60070 [Dactylosporangium sp. AC04546]|uniref:hypothetical protein n=1 Tax=Dactylosporangium sp. AC04546 TaxID=2862460 RepID=UPI001EDCB509|nr:hypothetical protein [Dactylosporangium sp. AC04546]WVK83873.1 hypothetical protein KZZ52_60070 [Dactylosporangium sp. AC04546]